MMTVMYVNVLLPYFILDDKKFDGSGSHTIIVVVGRFIFVK